MSKRNERAPVPVSTAESTETVFLIDSLQGARYKPELIPEGQSIFSQYSIADIAYLLLDGVVQLERESDNGKRFIQVVAGPSIIGYETLASERGKIPRYLSSAKAKKTCWVQPIHYSELPELVKDPHNQEAFLIVLENRQQELTERLRTQISPIDYLIRRVVQDILHMSERHGSLTFVQEEIGDMIGRTRVMVNKHYRDLVEPILWKRKRMK